jgi:two-component system, OmpR family, alkaline phosphatase synthesis response regulator PhoP
VQFGLLLLRGHGATGMAELIFVIDGDLESCRLAQRYLQEGGYSVRTFSTVADLEKVQNCRPSLMLIASTLPDGSGLDLCRRIRRNHLENSIPVILVTTGTGEEQNCAALEAGADLCLIKPFSPRELMARVQAAMRRTARSFRVVPADIVIDHTAMKLSVRGTEVATTTLEFRLVDYLARHRGRTFTRDGLLDAVWGKMQFVTPRSVDACIRRLREKIEPDIKSPTYVKTVRGIGYRFDAEAIWPTPPLGRCNCLACTPSKGRTTQVRSLKLIRREAAS